MGLIETNSSYGWHYDMANFSIDSANQSSNATTMEDSGHSVFLIATKVVMMCVLAVIMFSMGCQISVSQLKVHLRRPLGIAIGAVSQFVLLPLAAFGVGHALQLPPLQALGMLVMTCCPGGAMSNIYTYWLDGDVPLSVSMTTINTALSFGMMPFNLWLYGRSWTTSKATIPYRKIGETFTMVVAPVVAGMLLRWRQPSKVAIVAKVGSVTGMLGVALTQSMLVSQYYNKMFFASWQIFFAVFLIPFLAYTLGYGLAWIFRMEPPQRRTVSMETAIQNFPLGMALLALSYSKDDLKDVVVYPLLFGLCQILYSTVFVLGFRLKEWAARRLLPGKQQQQKQQNGRLDCEKEQDMVNADAAKKEKGHVTDDAVKYHVIADDAEDHVTDDSEKYLYHVIADDAGDQVKDDSEKFSYHVIADDAEKDGLVESSEKTMDGNSHVV